jgi:hypothetical protein
VYLRIKNDIVRKNVEIFKIILKKAMQAQEDMNTTKITQHFNAFINRARGEIRFADLHTEPLDEKEWEAISFNFSAPKEAEESFSIEISDINEQCFSWKGFQPEAIVTLKETLKTIQFISKFLPRLKNLSAVLREFSLTNLDTFLDQLSTKDLIHEAWHSLTKQECEKLLMKQSPGVFLFRKDEFASILEDQLSLNHKEQIRCITLSYVSSFGKISDLTLVKRKKGWVIYNDDPTLEELIYPSARSLLESLRGTLKTPLLHS